MPPRNFYLPFFSLYFFYSSLALLSTRIVVVCFALFHWWVFFSSSFLLLLFPLSFYIFSSLSPSLFLFFSFSPSRIGACFVLFSYRQVFIYFLSFSFSLTFLYIFFLFSLSFFYFKWLRDIPGPSPDCSRSLPISQTGPDRRQNEQYSRDRKLQVHGGVPHHNEEWTPHLI